MKRSTFHKCSISFRSDNLIELGKVFQPDYNGGTDYEFEYSNDDDDTFLIMCVDMQPESSWFWIIHVYE